jgi:hypothetical protein
VERWTEGVDAPRLGKLALAAVLGLGVNSLALVAVIGGGDVMGIADGVAYLAPVVIIAAWVHDAYNPLDRVYLGPAVLFLTLAVANLISLSVKVFRMAGQAEPLMTLMVIGFLSLMFTPGPFLTVWATRRWWL